MKTKIRHIKRISNPYGGILFCFNELRGTGLLKLIDKELGKRPKQSKYKYSDVVMSWIYSVLCGSRRLEDTNSLRRYFSEIPEAFHPSPDVIGRVFKSFASKVYNYEFQKSDHQFNIHLPLNTLLINTALKLKMIVPDADNVLDYDNVLTACEKFDSRLTYKLHKGYSPGVAFIGKIPVYVENRNGNSPAFYKIDETIERSLALLKQQGVTIRRFRSDSAAYNKALMRKLENRNIEFFIRAKNSKAIFRNAMWDNTKWDHVMIGGTPAMATSVDYSLGGRKYRVVITKMRDSRRKYESKYSLDMDTMRAIITNCREMTNQDVVAFYNMRASAELNFTDLLNDWNWKRLPFSFLNENTVFMIMSAIGKVIYHYLLNRFSKKIPFLKPNYRLKKFISSFISVLLEWRVENGTKVACLDDMNRDYSPLFGRPPS